MHEAAKNKREADATRARLEAEIKMTESMVENDLNNERRKKLQEKQRVRRQVEDEITELTSELFSKKVCGVGYEGTQVFDGVLSLLPNDPEKRQQWPRPLKQHPSAMPYPIRLSADRN